MGRRKDPTNLKLLRGTLRKDRSNPLEPVPSSERPDPPSFLDAIAIEEWHRMVVELEALGLVSKFDHAALEAYCANYSRWKRSEETLRREGDIIEFPNGAKGPHPAIRIVNQALSLMRQYLIEFGMSPSSRANVKTPKKEEKKSPFAVIDGLKKTRR